GRMRGVTKGARLAMVLYRLQQIGQRLDKMLSAELYPARHEALQSRVAELERQQDESARSIRQVVVGLVLAVGTALVTAGLTFTGEESMSTHKCPQFGALPEKNTI